jgi:hypothetical protein
VKTRKRGRKANILTDTAQNKPAPAQRPCVRCRVQVDIGKASHCLCVGHEPGKGWLWCSRSCMRYSHKKELDKSERRD